MMNRPKSFLCKSTFKNMCIPWYCSNTLMLFISNQDKQISGSLRRKKQNLAFPIKQLFYYSYVCKNLAICYSSQKSSKYIFHGSPKMSSHHNKHKGIFWQYFTPRNYTRLAVLLCPMHVFLF